MTSIALIAKGVVECVDAYRSQLIKGPHTWSTDAIEGMSAEFNKQIIQAALGDKTVEFNK